MSKFLERISEIIEATEQEIAAANKNKKDGFRQLKAGKRTGVAGQSYLYAFNCDKNLPDAEEITAISVRVKGSRTDCQIVRVTDELVEIAIEKELGEEVEKAILCWEEVSLLRKLVQELSLLTDDDEGKFELSEKVFDGCSHSITCKSKEPSFRKDEHAPNDSQLNAIRKSFQSSLAVIWGPPGSGKTRTIARAVEAHVREGRRVLLVSHANSAVDQLLRGVAEQLSDNYYKRGEVIRLGKARDSDLLRDYPLIDPEAFANEQQGLLDQELSLFEEEKDKLIARLKDLEGYKVMEQARAEESQRIQQVLDEASVIEQKHRHLMNEVAQLEETLSLLEPSTNFSMSDQSDSPGGGIRKQLVDSITQRNEELDELQDRHEVLASILKTASAKHTEISNQIRKALGFLTNDSIEESLNTAHKEISAAEASMTALKTKHKIPSNMEIISKARVVACTLFKTVNAAKYMGEFDIVILDEASMAPQAYLYWACGLATRGVTICGDFKQLPPVAQATSEPGISWYVKSIFDRLGISSVKDALQDQRVALLDTQYRMTPKIGDLSNNLFYGGKLKNAPSTDSLGFEDPLSGATPLVLIDTSQRGPRCQRIDGEGRFNMYESVLCHYLLSMLATTAPSISVGVCSPYKLQARVVKELCAHLQCKEFCSDTVHKYQGRERDVMIFTCADSAGVNNAPMFEKDRDAEILLNVALTRARKKVYFIANVQYFKKLGTNKIINRVIDYVSSNGQIICASKLDLASHSVQVENQTQTVNDQKLRKILSESNDPIIDASYSNALGLVPSNAM